MYWNRAVLKGAAKEELKQSFWLYVGILLLPVAITVAASFVVGLVSGILGFIAPWGASFFLSIVTSFGVTFFVTYPLTVGQCNFMIRAPYNDRDFNHLFMAFRTGYYWSIVKTMFFMGLSVFLWSLLFIVPGIIKAYQYCMVPYIISENPELSPKEALRISKEMTDGEKFDILVLDLSFIGWMLLASLGMGIVMAILMLMNPFVGIALGYLLLIAAMFVVLLYMRATYAQLYFALRYKYFSGDPAKQAQAAVPPMQGSGPMPIDPMAAQPAPPPVPPQPEVSPGAADAQEAPTEPANDPWMQKEPQGPDPEAEQDPWAQPEEREPKE